MTSKGIRDSWESDPRMLVWRLKLFPLKDSLNGQICGQGKLFGQADWAAHQSPVLCVLFSTLFLSSA